jgi:hypothetical protein
MGKKSSAGWAGGISKSWLSDTHEWLPVTAPSIIVFCQLESVEVFASSSLIRSAGPSSFNIIASYHLHAAATSQAGQKLGRDWARTGALSPYHVHTHLNWISARQNICDKYGTKFDQVPYAHGEAHVKLHTRKYIDIIAKRTWKMYF